MPTCKLNSAFLQHSKVSRFLHSSPFPFCHCPSRQLVPLYILLLLQCRYKEHPGEFILQTKLISRELGGVILPHFASSSYVCSSDTRSPSWLLPGTENLPCAGDYATQEWILTRSPLALTFKSFWLSQVTSSLKLKNHVHF